MRIAPREQHQVTGVQSHDRTLGGDEFAPFLDNDVDAAKTRLVESDAEWRSELEPAIGGALEPQLTEHRRQDVSVQRDGRWGFADAHTWSVHHNRPTVDSMTTTTEAPLGTGIGGLDRIAQVKLPVTDLARSVRWYRRFLDLRLWFEIIEDGVLRGAGLIDPQQRFNVALRDRSVCASQPDLEGFDVVAFLPADRTVLEDLTKRCDRLGIHHSEIQDGPEGSRLDVPDPDGTVLRFYHFTAPTSGFTGVEYRDGQLIGSYESPRLS